MKSVFRRGLLEEGPKAKTIWFHTGAYGTEVEAETDTETDTEYNPTRTEEGAGVYPARGARRAYNPKNNFFGCVYNPAFPLEDTKRKG